MSSRARERNRSYSEAMTVHDIAAQMYAECVRSEQSARSISAEDEAGAIRREIRSLARADGLRIRTARVENTVVAVRLDAKVWEQSTAIMREKLAPR